MGLSRQTFIYAGRLAKDRLFAAEHPLWYVVWHHRAATKDASTVGGLRRLVVASLQGVFVAPFAAVDAVCSGLKEEPLNSRYGPAHKYGTHAQVDTYGSGFRIGLKYLLPYLASRYNEAFAPGAEVQPPRIELGTLNLNKDWGQDDARSTESEAAVGEPPSAGGRRDLFE